MEIITKDRVKEYNTTLIVRSKQYLDIQKSLELIADFIRERKLIIYGGMAIDFALKRVGKPGIYGNDVIPDYDFFSTDSVSDSNELGIILRDAGLPNISCINALHKSTRKVRVNFVNVADITYRPKEIFDKIPTFEYEGFLCVHPDFQEIDNHRSSVYLLENAPLETINHRIEKDMDRYNLMEIAYPTGNLINEFDELISLNIPVDKLNGAVLCGLSVYAVYVEILERYIKSSGVKIKMQSVIPTEYDVNSIKVPENYMDIFKVCILTDDFPGNITGSIEYFNQTLDIIPRRVETDSYTLYDNRGKIISTAIFDYEVPNIQWLLMYSLFKYHMTMDSRYKNVYIATQHLVKYADKLYKKIKEKSLDDATIFLKTTPFFINTNRYGKYNQSDSFLDMFKEKRSKIMEITWESDKPDVFFPSNSSTWGAFDYSRLKLGGEQVNILYQKEMVDI